MNLTQGKIRLIGLPGTGKTTTLLKWLAKLLRSYNEDEIIFCSFSNAAVREIKQRIEKIHGSNQIQITTMHALCRKLSAQLVTRRCEVYQMHRDQFEHIHKIELPDRLLRNISREQFFSPSRFRNDLEEASLAQISIERLMDNDLSVLEWSQKFMQHVILTNPEVVNNMNLPKIIAEKLREINIPLRHVESLTRHLIQYFIFWTNFKLHNKLFEFDDFLIDVLKNNLVPRAKVLIIDEYQDSSGLQNAVMQQWTEVMSLTIVAGDPNQAIYGFNGAIPKYLNGFEPDQDILLNRSYRVPQPVVDYAKTILPTDTWVQQMVGTKSQGSVTEIPLPDLELVDCQEKYDSIYVLGRTRSILSQFEDFMVSQGLILSEKHDEYSFFYSMREKVDEELPLVADDISKLLHHQKKRSVHIINKMWQQELIKWVETPKTNTQKELPISVLYKITGTKDKQELIDRLQLIIPPKKEYHRVDTKRQVTLQQVQELRQKLKLMTMHNSKGREADLVIVINAASPYEDTVFCDPDEERRLFYVAATRTRKDLIIVDLEDGYRVRSQFLPEVMDTGIEDMITS